MPRTQLRAGLIGLFLAFLLPAAAGAQLRPLEPAPWTVFQDGRHFEAGAGLGIHQHQRASLAGVEGRLLELGNFQAVWRSGRIALEAGGTVVRVFDERSSFAPPHDEVASQDGPRRRDAGDYRVATSVLLTPPGGAAAALLRFGTRLPTTDNRVGLDRDQTDFFALLGGQVRGGGLRLAGEAGVGIYGTRSERHEQSDALVYTLSAEYARGRVAPTLLLTGHADAFDDWTPRGNEDLAELRAGVRFGGRYWLRAEWVVGLQRYSPGSGLLLTAGVAR